MASQSMASISLATATEALPGQRGGTAPTSAQKPHFYKPELDVVRCLAFLLVFTHHAIPRLAGANLSFRGLVQEMGAAGVCLFFTLSSFLITELLLREREATGTFRIKAFYVRRVLRIWPLYLAVLLAGVIFPHFYHKWSRGEGLLLPYLLMAGNWAVAAHGSWPRNPILNPLWSISVEEQFYVVWPTLFLLWKRRGIIAAIVIVLPVAWIADFVLASAHVSKDPVLWVNSLSQFQFFALGGALALLTHRRPLRLSPVLRSAVLAAAVGFLALSAFPFHTANSAVSSTPWQVLAGYLSIDAACILLLLGFLDLPLPRAFGPLVYLGRISYGLYIFHFFVLNLVEHVLEKRRLPFGLPHLPVIWLAGLTLVIPLATLSYEYFEKPFLRFKSRFTFVSTRVAEAGNAPSSGEYLPADPPVGR